MDKCRDLRPEVEGDGICFRVPRLFERKGLTEWNGYSSFRSHRFDVGLLLSSFDHPFSASAVEGPCLVYSFRLASNRV